MKSRRQRIVRWTATLLFAAFAAAFLLPHTHDHASADAAKTCLLCHFLKEHAVSAAAITVPQGHSQFESLASKAEDDLPCTPFIGFDGSPRAPPLAS